MTNSPDMDPFWVQNRAEFLAKGSVHADPNACGTCRRNVAAGEPVEHDGCEQRATLLHAPDHPHYEILAGFSLEENAALPARFHVPVFDDCGKPNTPAVGDRTVCRFRRTPDRSAIIECLLRHKLLLY